MKLVKKVTAIACAGVLAGCVNGSSDSAWRLMEDQQQEQAMMQRQEMDDARKKAPEKEQLLIMTIKEAQDQGRYFASLAFIDEYAVKYGKSPDVEILRAEALRKTDQHAQSEKIYRSLTKTNQKARAWHGLGLMAGQRGDLVEAAKNLENASSASPSDAVILSDLAYARMRIGDIEGARIPIGKAAELMPQNPKVLSNMALYLLVRGATPAAEQVMKSANLGQQARQEIYAIADQVRRLPLPSSQASNNASSPEEDNQVRGVSNLRASADDIKKKQDEIASASRSTLAQNSQDPAFELQLPASAPLPADIQPRPDARPQARIQPEPEPQLVNIEQQVAKSAEPVRTTASSRQLVRGNEPPLQMAPSTNDPIAMMQPEFILQPMAQQQAEEKRQRELAQQQAEEKRQRELAQQQAEEKRQRELAQQQAEEKRQRELAQQQAEEKRQLELNQAKQDVKSQQLVRGNEQPLQIAPPTNDPIAMMQPEFVWPPVTQQQAEEKRLAEVARQQVEEKRQAELAQRQVEEQRQLELAQTQAEEKRLSELAQQQAEEKRLSELAQQQAEEKRQAELAQQQAEEKRLAELAQQQAEEKRQAELAQQQAEEKRQLAATASRKPVAQTQAMPAAKSSGRTSAIDRSILDEVSIVGGDFILKRK
ncbi:hypothetical protein [Advenella alkanexedens]|uniref:hypothetical protein n=1 Tax=Advenella alkanexedens TaxID=1481665 RepID=UPI002674E6B5|nr:hypothetical protein [Advenella alkanexedens]WKU19599.1 hypothetical protein Q3V95_00710 [Advenella alkanexedens]